jgi:tape measure domain-containing protein
VADDVAIRLGLTGQPQTKRGLDQIAASERKIGDDAGTAGARVRSMSAALNTVGKTSAKNIGAGLTDIGRAARYGAAGLAGLTLAGVKWGLQTNSQVEQARLRFTLFTNDVDGLTASVRELDKNSAFSFADLADAAAMLGGSGIQNVPQVLQAVANAAAGGGKGTEGLQAITLALSQIQSKGRLSQEEVNQLTEGGAITAQRDLAAGLGLTAKQLQNLGGQGIEASKAIDVLTNAWTSGQMADIAKRQTQTLGGQWNLLTGNLQTATATATENLARNLRTQVLPAANDAVQQITRILGDDGLTDRQKLQRARTIIRQELGPIAHDLANEFRDSGLGDQLEQAFEHAMNKMATVAINQAPHIVAQFVDAWLGAGPWAKLISGEWLAHKLGIDKALLGLLIGKAGAKGAKGGGGALGKASKLAPVPVYVTNWGGTPAIPAEPSKPGVVNRVKDTLKVAVPAAATAARTAVVPAAADLAPAFGPLAAIAWLMITQGNHNFPTRGPGASSPSNPAGSIPAPGFGGSMPGLPPGGLNATPVNVPVTVKLDEQVLAKAQAQFRLHQQGRGK